MYYVYVLNSSGVPLMPTTRYGKVRRMLKTGQNKKYHALSVLNQIMPQMLKKLEMLYPGQTFITTGMDTKAYRDDHGIAKDHDTDAYCIACSTLENQAMLDIPENSFIIRQFRRHDRQLIKAQTERTYRLDGQAVAKNRRKRMDQKEPSLHEWFQAMKEQYGRQEARQMQSKLTVSKSARRYNNPARLLPGFQVQYRGRQLTITGQRTNGRYYLSPQEPGVNIPARDVTRNRCNAGLVYV